MAYLPVSLRYGLHPSFPERAGFGSLLDIVNPGAGRLLRLTRGYTLMGTRNQVTLLRAAQAVINRDVAGDFLEIGVHRGGSAAVLAHVIKEHPERTLHLFDRWGDLPDTTANDGVRAEEYKRSKIQHKIDKIREEAPLDATVEVIEGVIGLPHSRVRYHAGWYEDTLAQFGNGKIAFASVDCDYFESVRLTLDFLESRLSAGAVLIVDDYTSWPGARKATDAWLALQNRVGGTQLMPTGPLLIWMR